MSFSSFCSPICLIPHKQNNRPNASIVVEFTRFDTEWSYDIVYVYDGTDFTTATNLGEYTGSQSTVEYIPKVRYIPVLLTFGLIKQQRLYRPRELSWYCFYPTTVWRVVDLTCASQSVRIRSKTHQPHHHLQQPQQSQQYPAMEAAGTGFVWVDSACANMAGKAVHVTPVITNLTTSFN